MKFREMTMIPGAWRYAILALLWACTPSESDAPPVPAGHQPGEEAAVLEAMNRYVAAISASDLETMAAMQTPEGMTYRARATEGGAWEVVARPNSYWVDPSQADGRAYQERYWSPTVLVRGGIAVVWAPYEFRIDGQRSHCGVDVFDFVKIDGEWRVSNSMWTVEPEACDDLLPVDISLLQSAARPGLADFATRYAAAWSSQDPDRFAAFYTADGSLTVNDGAHSRGRAAVRTTAEGFMQAFPDMRVVLDSVTGWGDHAVFHWTWTGTNTGPGGTGRAVRLSGYEEWTFGPDGLIASSEGHYDEADYQRQMAGPAGGT